MIEHNPVAIKTADHILDLGPGGGVRGGEIVAQGTPEEVAAVPESYTGQYLKPKLERASDRRARRRSRTQSRANLLPHKRARLRPDAPMRSAFNAAFIGLLK